MQTLVLVEWADAHQGTDGWTEIVDLDEEPRLIVTVGFLLLEGAGGKKDHLTLAQSIDVEQEMVDNVLNIPTPMVRSMRVLSCDAVGGEKK